VDLPDFVNPAGVKEDPFGGSGLAGVYVGHDPNISDFS
jgi:hypothetical protein